MYRDLEPRTIGGKEFLLAPGRRVSGDPRIEREVLEPSHFQPKVRSERTLIGIGGAAVDSNLGVVVDHLPKDGLLAVSTVNTQIPTEQFESYSERFKQMGHQQEPIHHGVHLIPQEADAAMRIADGMFFTGGDQSRGVDYFSRSGQLGRLHSFYHSGRIVSGTSAGAHLMGEVTPFHNEVRPGVGLTKLISFETHLNRRFEPDQQDRQRRVVDEADVVSVGLEEGGVVVVTNDEKLNFHNKDANLRWRYNGVQRSREVSPRQEVVVWKLPRKYSILSSEK